MGMDTGLADDHAILGDARGQVAGMLQIDGQIAQVAVIDADHRGAKGNRALEFIAMESHRRFGGLTASYYQNDELKVQRQETEVNYEFIREWSRWPEGFKSQPGQPLVAGRRVSAFTNSEEIQADSLAMCGLGVSKYMISSV